MWKQLLQGLRRPNVVLRQNELHLFKSLYYVPGTVLGLGDEIASSLLL